MFVVSLLYFYCIIDVYLFLPIDSRKITQVACPLSLFGSPTPTNRHLHSFSIFLCLFVIANVCLIVCQYLLLRDNDRQFNLFRTKNACLASNFY